MYLVHKEPLNCCDDYCVYCNEKIIVPGAQIFIKSGISHNIYTCYDVIQHIDDNCWVLEANAEDSYIDEYNVSDEEVINYYNERYGVYLPIDNLEMITGSDLQKLKKETVCSVGRDYFEDHIGTFYLRDYKVEDE